MQVSSHCGSSLSTNPGVLPMSLLWTFYGTVLCLERKAIAWDWRSLSFNPGTQLQNYDTRCRSWGYWFFCYVESLSNHSRKNLKNSWNTLVPAVLQFSGCYPVLLINSPRSTSPQPSPAIHICQREILPSIKNGVGAPIGLNNEAIVPRKFPLVNTKPLWNAIALNIKMVSSGRQVSLYDWK